MRIKILHGSEAGQVQEYPDGDTWAEVAVQTGYAELAPKVDVVPTRVRLAASDSATVSAGWFPHALNPISERESSLGPVVVADQADLNTLTVAQLEDIGDLHNIEAKDIDGTGSGGGVLKADWVRVLEAVGDAADE